MFLDRDSETTDQLGQKKHLASDLTVPSPEPLVVLSALGMYDACMYGALCEAAKLRKKVGIAAQGSDGLQRGNNQPQSSCNPCVQNPP